MPLPVFHESLALLLFSACSMLLAFCTVLSLSSLPSTGQIRVPFPPHRCVRLWAERHLRRAELDWTGSAGQRASHLLRGAGESWPSSHALLAVQLIKTGPAGSWAPALVVFTLDCRPYSCVGFKHQAKLRLHFD